MHFTMTMLLTNVIEEWWLLTDMHTERRELSWYKPKMDKTYPQPIISPESTWQECEAVIVCTTLRTIQTSITLMRRSCQHSSEKSLPDTIEARGCSLHCCSHFNKVEKELLWHPLKGSHHLSLWSLWYQKGAEQYEHSWVISQDLCWWPIERSLKGKCVFSIAY